MKQLNTFAIQNFTAAYIEKKFNAQSVFGSSSEGEKFVEEFYFKDAEVNLEEVAASAKTAIEKNYGKVIARVTTSSKKSGFKLSFYFTK